MSNPDGNFSSSPDRKTKINHKVASQPTSAETYIKKDLSQPGQEHNERRVFYAKQVLDDNLLHMSKDAYMRYNKDIVVDKDPNSIRALLEYRYYDPFELN